MLRYLNIFLSVNIFFIFITVCVVFRLFRIVRNHYLVYQKKNYLLLILILIFYSTACKKKSQITSCIRSINSEFNDLNATLPTDNSFYHGGYLEIIDDMSIVRCDVLIYPIIDSYAQPLSIDQWEGFTLTISRSCMINLYQQSDLYLLIYMKDIINNNNDIDSADYLRVPIKSPYLTKLGELRSEFLTKASGTRLKTQNGESGDIDHILFFHERMKRQIYQSSTLLPDYKKIYGDLGININDLTNNFLLVQQANNCSPSKITNDLSIEYSSSKSPRYKQMISKRSNGENSSIACYIFTDLIQFDGEFEKTDKTDIALEAMTDKSLLTPKGIIARRVNEIPNISSAIENWSNNFVTKNAVNLLQSLEDRINNDLSTEQQLKELLLANNDQRNYISSVSKNYWTKIPFTKNYKSIWNRQQSMNFFDRSLGQISRNITWKGHLTALEEDISFGRNQINFDHISVAGNSINADTNQSIFSNIMVKIFDNSAPSVDQTLFFLLINFKPQQNSNKNRNPLDVLSFGSFLLYSGQPVGVFLSKNNFMVTKPENYKISILNLNFWERPQKQQTVDTLAGQNNVSQAINPQPTNANPLNTPPDNQQTLASQQCQDSVQECEQPTELSQQLAINVITSGSAGIDADLVPFTFARSEVSTEFSQADGSQDETNNDYSDEQTDQETDQQDDDC